jgi:hypothetical protein
VKLGGDHGARPTAKQRARAIAVRQEQARNRRSTLLPLSQELQESGAVSLRAIAAGLDERGISAARGGSWSATQVQRLLELISDPFADAGQAQAQSHEAVKRSGWRAQPAPEKVKASGQPPTPSRPVARDPNQKWGSFPGPKAVSGARRTSKKPSPCATLVTVWG